MNKWMANFKYPLSFIKHPALCSWLTKFSLNCAEWLCNLLPWGRRPSRPDSWACKRAIPSVIPASLLILLHSSARTCVSVLELPDLTAHLNLPLKVQGQQGIVMEDLVSGTGLPRLKRSFYRILPLWSWLIHITSLFEFHIFKMWLLRVTTSWRHGGGLHKLIQLKHLAQCQAYIKY